MAEGEFQLRQETLVATIEAYEHLTKNLATYKEEQQLIIDSVKIWDNELSQTFRDSYSKMLNERYAKLEEKSVKITEILQKGLEETNRLLNRRDALPETLSPSLALPNPRLWAYMHLFENWGYSSVRTTGGILKLDESLRSDVETSCDQMLDIVEKEKMEVDNIKSILSGLGLNGFSIESELNELEACIVSQKSIENFKESFVAYCDGVKELDAYLTEEFGKVTEAYGELLDAENYKAVRDNTLNTVTQINVHGLEYYLAEYSIEELPLSPENRMYVENLKNAELKKGNYDISEDKRKTIVAMATILLSVGYEVEFVAGVLANIIYEGEVGKFESSNYESNPQKKPGYLKYMDAYHNYREEFSGKNIIDVGINETRDLWDTLDENGRKGKFGLGCVQWTDLDRVDGLLGCYERIYKNGTALTLEQCIQAEGLWIVTELEEESEYIDMYMDWKRDSATGSSEEQARAAGITFCKRYERPKADTSQERGALAVKVIQAMTK